MIFKKEKEKQASSLPVAVVAEPTLMNKHIERERDRYRERERERCVYVYIYIYIYIHMIYKSLSGLVAPGHSGRRAVVRAS